MSAPHILILTTKLGFGHMNAAKALAATLPEVIPDCRVTISNPVEEEQTSEILRGLHDSYDEASGWEGLYKFLYRISDTNIAARATDSAVSVMLRESVHEVLEKYQPDVIVSVHEDFLAPLHSLKQLTGDIAPVVTVITDLTTIHRRWFNVVADVTIVPTETAHKKALAQNLAADSVRTIGVPVHPTLANETRSVADLRESLGWQPDTTTLLVVGSKRVGGLVENLRGVNHSNLDLQLALVAGGDDDLHAAFQQTEWHLPTHIYNYVEDMSPMQHAADIVVSKAGGLIVSESLACGKPLLITDVIEGQETGNLAYVKAHNAGAEATTPITVLETLYHWLADDAARLREVAANARHIGQPRAAYDIAEIVHSLCNTTQAQDA